MVRKDNYDLIGQRPDLHTQEEYVLANGVQMVSSEPLTNEQYKTNIGEEYE